MFSGIVEETGTVRKAVRQGGSLVFVISGKKSLKGLQVDDSISVNGVCLTVVKRTRNVFHVQAVEETLGKTNLALLRRGSKTNLERPLAVSDRLSGHFVLGHIDCVGRIRRIEKRRSSKVLWIKFPREFQKYLIQVGSIAVDGVSLTISHLKPAEFAVSVIPHTLDLTTFGALQEGAVVNLEFDVLGKYLESLFRKKRR